MTDSSTESSSPLSLDGEGGLPVVELVAVTLARVVLNSTHRMVYPFLPAFGRGLGVTSGAMRRIVSARWAVGFASPLFGPLSDRFGRRAMMLVALAVLTLALLLVPLWSVYWVAFVAFVLMGLGKVIYDPSMQAYVGDRVPYQRRGFALGVTELAWSAGVLIGAPLIGLSIQRLGWVSPFVGLSVLSALAGVGILAFIRRDTGVATGQRGALGRSWKILLNHPPALGAIAFAVLISAANEIIFVVYGEWMESSFGLEVGALGLLTSVIGVAELVGEVLVTIGSDRVGKRRIVLVGLVGSAIGYLLLPQVGVTLPSALAVLFFMFVFFEVTIVASIPIASELLPDARATMMSTYQVGFAGGRSLGALGAGALLSLGGFALNGLVASVISVAALVVVIALVPETSSVVKGADSAAD